jgi:molybdopterin-guanine dinucleotide biosynthesis protein A
LDKKGVCQKVYNELANAESHVDEAIEVLADLKQSQGPLAGFLG